ncbi:MAG: hypothetical protein D6702_05240 [Planctomycetota bacterium]|nr:MAG: hypothetical protein D6702_05240 [Planctomycetota bacterium]
MRRLLPLLLLAAACGEEPGPAAAPPAGRAADPRPDVVLVMLDTLRPDHLQLYGYEKETSPFLAELGASSAVFERAISSSSWTAPAVTSILTGLYPTGHGIIEGFLAFLRRDQRGQGEILPLNRLPEDVATLPLLLRDAGFATWGLAANLNVGPEIGLDRGFEHFEQLRKADAAAIRARLEALRSEIEAEARPRFLYLHFMDPHEPYHRRRPWYEKQRGTVQDAAARYDSEIRFLDENLGALYRELGWERDTLLVIVSDHGEEFREHGRTGHEFSLYGELNRVVFLVRPPGGMAGRRIDSRVSLIDVAPTVLALAGVPVPAGLDGMNLAPLIDGQADAPAAFAGRTLFAHRWQVLPEKAHLWAAVRGDEKLIAGPDGLEFYDLAADPGEHDDRYRRDLPAAAALLQALARFRGRGFRSTEKVEIGSDPALVQELQALGYVEEDGDGE